MRSLSIDLQKNFAGEYFKGLNDGYKEGLADAKGGGLIKDFSYFCRDGLRVDEIGNIDTSGGTNFQNMFEETSITEVPPFDLSNAETIDYLFYYCSKLTKTPPLNTKKCESFCAVFGYCTSLTEVSEVDTSNAKTVDYMFTRCDVLETVPYMDTSKCDNFYSMFFQAYNLKSVPELNTSNGTDFGDMFGECRKLTEVPALDTSKATDMSSMFGDCASLVTIHGLDLRNEPGVNGLFKKCPELTNVIVRNIKTDLNFNWEIDGTWPREYAYCEKLSVDSLVGVIYELINTGSSKTLTIGSVNLAKLANVYVKLIDITDEMRATDEFIDQKLPFEVCESTDAGAMLITNYIGQKNWVLA